MKRQQWYYAHLRWAVMVDGKEGLRHWEEAVHIFQSDDRDMAFQRRWRSATKQSAAMTKGGGGWKAGWPRL
jgi:hypothetical protein